MRLRKKPWIEQAIQTLGDFVFTSEQRILSAARDGWAKEFSREAPLRAELGCGKGRFIGKMAERRPDVNFIGVEAQLDVAYYAALKLKEAELKNARILVFDINRLEEIFRPGEVDRFYINFCDPWPKKRHAKRRLTHANFLTKYGALLKSGGQIHFKTDNRPLFDFSLEQFKELNLDVSSLTFDLHADCAEDNVMTEYEEKFSNLGQKINRCEVSFPR